MSKALQTLALLSVARRIGLRRGRKLLLLAATGYIDEQRKRSHRR
ncbi:MAG: hypothetical protein ACJ757_04370 [Gaiellaceae bacterium]